MDLAIIRVFSCEDETVKESHGRIIAERFGTHPL